MGIIVHGRRPYGRVESFEETCVLTTFHHIWWLPIVPMGSYVLAKGQMLPIGWHWGSILAAYLRTWGAFWLVIAVIGISQGSRELVLAGVPAWVDVAALVGLVAAGWLLVGRIPRKEAEQRLVYGKFAGLAVDVVRLSLVQSTDLRNRLRAVLTEEGRALLSSEEGRALGSAYRDGPDPAEAWREVAVHPAIRKVEYLEAALTLARVESRWAVRRERGHLRSVHEKIWAKMTEQPFQDVG